MKKTTTLLLTAVLTAFAGAEEIRNRFTNPDFSSGMKHWELVGDIGTATPENGGITLDVRKCTNSGKFKLQQALTNLKIGHTYRFYFTVTSEKPQTRPIVVSYRMRKKSKNLGLFKPVHVWQGTQKLFVELVPGEESSDPNDPPVLALYLGEMDGKVTLSEMFLVDLQQIKAEKPPFSDKWTVFGVIDPNAGAVDAIPETLPDVNGKPLKPVSVKVRSAKEDRKINLRLETSATRKRLRDAAMLYNEFESGSDRIIPVGFGADWWMEIYLNGKIVYSTMTDGNRRNPVSSANHFAFLPVKKGKNLLAVKILAGGRGWVFHWGPVQPPAAPETFTAKEGYHPIDTAKLAIKKGSALDLSSLIDAPAGKYGRAVITPDGHIAFEKNSTPQRFLGFTSYMDEKVWKTSKDKDFPFLAAEYARAIRAQGYNLFRMHGFDSWIMAFSTEDKTPLPRYVDRWDRMVYELKQQGIYLQLDIFSFWLYSSARGWFQVAEKRMANKILFILGDSAIRERFTEMSGRILNHVNPYTKLAWKDDPVFIAVEYYNELGLAIPYAEKLERTYPDVYKFFKAKWSAFLNQKYANVPQAKRPYPPAVFEKAPVPGISDRNQLRSDYDEFWYEHLKETYRFCDQVMKDNGYKGLTLQCPMPALRCAAVSWESLPIVDAHGYHCHPDGGEQPGAIVKQDSSVADASALFRRRFSDRMYGRPFFLNEHNYVFRNAYQYEKPIMLNAFAAMNDWDALAIHSGVVALTNDQRLSSFYSANNPVLRAGEFLSSLFFLRRDVAPAKHKATVALTKKYVFTKGNSGSALNPTQSRLMLLTNVSTLFTDLPRNSRTPQPQKPDFVFQPAGSADIEWHGWFAEAKENGTSNASLESLVATLRKRGILPEDNITDLSKEIYQSETGELTVFAKEKKASVITPKSEAVALPAGKTEKLRTLEVRKNSVNTLIGLASVDNKPLKESDRMVLVLSTRVANTNMQHDASGLYLRVVGTLPVLYQCGEYEIRINRPGKLRCYALSLTGERMEEIPLTSTAAGTSLAFDMAKLKHGPTPFFELATEK